MNIFEKISDIVNGIEDSVINLLCVLAPWFVPVIPAYLTYSHTIDELSFPFWVAWTAAFVVEVLGLASMRTSISFFEHNKRYSKDTNRAPVGLSISTYIFYLFVILTVNVLLDLTKGVSWINVLAIGLFSLLSVPAGLLIAIRTQHMELLKLLSEQRSFRRSSKSSSETPEITSKTISRTSLASKWISKSRSRTGRPSVHQNSVFSYMDKVLATEGRVADFTEVVGALGISESTCSRLRNLWIENNVEKVNR
jgi:hypothetical protein